MKESQPSESAAGLDADAFRQLAESAPDGMLAHRDGRVVWANQAAARLVLLSDPAELVGRSVLDFVQPQNRTEIGADIDRTAATHRARRYTQTFVRSDGSLFDAELQRTPLSDGLMLVVVRDLSAARLQHLAEERARAFFEATTAAMGISCLGVHIEANAAYAKLFGYDDPAELVGRPILDLIDPSEHARIVEHVRRRADKQPVPDSYEVLARRRDGTTFTMGIKASSYVDRDQVISIVVVRDVSAERAEQAVLAHRERLEAIGRLAGGVAHDFNGILGVILGNVELSRRQLTPGSAIAEHLDTISEAALHARDLVRQILTFGRRDMPKPTALDPGRVVADALTMVRSAVPTSVTLDVHIAPVHGTVVADATQVQQVVLNLCANARDAVSDGGRIEVSVEEVDAAGVLPPPAAGRCVRLRVRDDGVGMDAPARAHLFEPYHTTKSANGGHGLGLAVVHGIVTRLGGAIRVDSAPGLGSTFEVFLPVSTSPAPPVSPRLTAKGSGAHVLLVDDDARLRIAQRRVLELMGYRVTDFGGGSEALTAWRAAPGAFDVVLSDIVMANMSGLELARAMLAERRDTRVVLYSGYAEGFDESAALAMGVRAVLAKPILPDDLAAALEATLAR